MRKAFSEFQIETKKRLGQAGEITVSLLKEQIQKSDILIDDENEQE